MMKLKRLGRIFACMAVLMAMLLAAGCQKSGNSSEESANAVLNQFLSGTVQDADEFDSQYAEIASAETDDETDMISVNGMDDYFQKQFGEIMTDAWHLRFDGKSFNDSSDETGTTAG